MLLPLLIFALAAAAPVSGQSAATAAAPLDTSAVTTVVITGDSSSIALSTRTDAPFEARIGGQRRGWFAAWYSSWFFGDCVGSASMRIDGAVLRIDASDSAWFDTSDCAVRIEANLPRRTTVSVDQQAFMATLTGAFGGVALVGKAADISLTGHATAIDIAGDAVRARIAFDWIERNETIDIDADALDARLSFGKAAAISYAVEATASVVDSALANTPGAMPRITIIGEFVRATIR